MTKIIEAQNTLSRRTVLRRGAILSTCLGLGLATTTGQAAAMNKAELIEAIASEARLASDEVTMALDAFIDVTTTALKAGDSVALAGFGAFSVPVNGFDGKGNDVVDEEIVVPRDVNGFDGKGNDVVRPPVDFEPCPEFAVALELNPGNGDQRRAAASSRCHKADVVIDAARIARETQHGEESGLSKADAKRALDGFINATTRTLQAGDDVSLAGFGSFSISKRSARTGRNPQTGKEIQIAAKNVVKFKAGAELSKAVSVARPAQAPEDERLPNGRKIVREVGHKK